MGSTALRLAGKVAIITGGGSGIGRAASLLFARAGCRVVVVDWKEEGGRETERLLEADGGEGTFIRADVSDGAAVEALVREDHGPLRTPRRPLQQRGRGARLRRARGGDRGRLGRHHGREREGRLPLRQARHPGHDRERRRLR